MLKFNPQYEGFWKPKLEFSPEFVESRQSKKTRDALVDAKRKAIEKEIKAKLKEQLRLEDGARLRDEKRRFESWAMNTVNHSNFPGWIESDERVTNAVAIPGRFLTGEEYVAGVDIVTSLGRKLHLRNKKNGMEFSEQKTSRMKRIRYGVKKWERARHCSSEETHTWLGANAYYGVRVRVTTHKYQNTDHPKTGEIWDVWHDEQGVWHAGRHRSHRG